MTSLVLEKMEKADPEVQPTPPPTTDALGNGGTSGSFSFGGSWSENSDFFRQNG